MECEHVSTEDTLACERISRQDKQAGHIGHVSPQGTLAHEHVSTQDTLACEQAHEHLSIQGKFAPEHIFNMQAT